MTGNDRREQIIHILTNSHKPISGNGLANQLHVSRQVIVQDMALLRANGYEILSTTKGYVIAAEPMHKRVFKIIHSNEEVIEELNMIVDLGGVIEDVFVYHKVYGIVRADMNIKSRRDVQDFLNKIESGKSSLLMNTTSGYHYHTILAEDEETLDIIFNALKDRGFLAPLQDYEPINFWD